MKVVCPCCATSFPLEAGLVEGDAKRLAVVFGELDPAVARACMGYLRLFKPVTQELRVNRAIAIVTDLAQLIHAGGVSRDERRNLHRPTTPAMWVQGMEQMQTSKLELPLKSHGYLRAVVFAIADTADAKAEVQREHDRRMHGGHRQPTHDASGGGLVNMYDDWLKRGIITQADHKNKMAGLPGQEKSKP